MDSLKNLHSWLKNKKAPPCGGALFWSTSSKTSRLLGYYVGRTWAFLALFNIEGYGLSFRQ